MGRLSSVTCPAASQETPNQEQVEFSVDHEDRELAPTKVDFHRRSASVSGLVALAAHTSKRSELRKSFFRGAIEVLGKKVARCSAFP